MIEIHDVVKFITVLTDSKYLFGEVLEIYKIEDSINTDNKNRKYYVVSNNDKHCKNYTITEDEIIEVYKVVEKIEKK